MGKGSRKKRQFGFNPKIAKLKVTKLEIVQREIDTSIDLYFSNGDLVSTHLLISAAHEILFAYDKKVLQTGMLFDHPEYMIKEEFLDEYRALMKAPFLGFKHGSKDLSEVVELPWKQTDWLMYSAIYKYMEITNRPTARMSMFVVWIRVHERLLTPEQEQGSDAEAIRSRFPVFARAEFREEYYPAFEKMAAQPPNKNFQTSLFAIKAIPGRPKRRPPLE